MYRGRAAAISGSTNHQNFTFPVSRRQVNLSWGLSATTPASSVTPPWRPWGRRDCLSTHPCPPRTGSATSSRLRPVSRDPSPRRISRSSVPLPAPVWWRIPGTRPSCLPPVVWTPSPPSRCATGGSSRAAPWRGPASGCAHSPWCRARRQPRSGATYFAK